MHVRNKARSGTATKEKVVRWEKCVKLKLAPAWYITVSMFSFILTTSVAVTTRVSYKHTGVCSASIVQGNVLIASASLAFNVKQTIGVSDPSAQFSSLDVCGSKEAKQWRVQWFEPVFRKFVALRNFVSLVNCVTTISLQSKRVMSCTLKTRKKPAEWHSLTPLIWASAQVSLHSVLSL